MFRLHSAWSSSHNKQLKSPPFSWWIVTVTHDINMPKFTLILRLAVQNGTSYKRLKSEIVYLICSRPNTLKTIPCSAAHSGWGQIGEYPLAKLTFLSGFRFFFFFFCWVGGGHFLCFLSKHYNNPSLTAPSTPFSCCGIHNVCCLSTWRPSSCQVGEDPGNKIGLKAEVLFIVIWVYTLYQRDNHLIFALFTVTFHGNRSTTQFIGIFSLQAVECWLTWRLKTN